MRRLRSILVVFVLLLVAVSSFQTPEIAVPPTRPPDLDESVPAPDALLPPKTASAFPTAGAAANDVRARARAARELSLVGRVLNHRGMPLSDITVSKPDLVFT